MDSAKWAVTQILTELSKRGVLVDGQTGNLMTRSMRAGDAGSGPSAVLHAYVRKDGVDFRVILRGIGAYNTPTAEVMLAFYGWTNTVWRKNVSDAARDVMSDCSQALARLATRSDELSKLCGERSEEQNSLKAENDRIMGLLDAEARDINEVR